MYGLPFDATIYFRMSQYNAQPKAAGNYMMMEPNLNQNNYHTSAQSGYIPPPPPLMHMNGGIARYEGPPQTRYTPDNVDMSAQGRSVEFLYCFIYKQFSFFIIFVFNIHKHSSNIFYLMLIHYCRHNLHILIDMVN